MEYAPVRTSSDVQNFMEAVNSLHDGYVLSVNYVNNGIFREGHELWLVPERNELRVTVMVTSIWDSMVELVFESVEKWRMSGSTYDIFDVLVEFDSNGSVIWTTGFSTEPKVMEENSYVIAKSMKWRFIEDHRPQI